MIEEELKKQYASEPWGKLLIEAGFDPYDTESSARRVAEFAAAKLETSKPKDHEITSLVNELTSTARNYSTHQSLRERIASIIRPLFK